MKPLLEDFLRNWRINKASKYIKEKSVVLDVGCDSDAFFLVSIKNKILTGCGLDPRIDSFKIYNLDLEKFCFDKTLPFKDNFFDHVTALAVLEHLDNPDFFIKEAKRVLKPNGTLIITTPSPNSHYLLGLMSKTFLVHKEMFEEHKKYFSIKTLPEAMILEGFKIIKVSTFEFGFNVFCVGIKEPERDKIV